MRTLTPFEQAAERSAKGSHFRLVYSGVTQLIEMDGHLKQQRSETFKMLRERYVKGLPEGVSTNDIITKLSDCRKAMDAVNNTLAQIAQQLEELHGISA